MRVKKTFAESHQSVSPIVPLSTRQMLLGGCILLAFAICYYLSYYRSGLNLGGEGGTVGLVAIRLLDGQRPLIDTFLGYNLMWFYPIVWLFKIFGPNYIALRLFFFALCTLTGLLAYITLCRTTRNVWYSVLVSLLPVLVPGMIFRNYLPFLAMLNMTLALWLFDFRNNSLRLLPTTASGFALGLTFLTRIDIGIFASVIFLGGIFLNVLKPGFPIVQKIRISSIQAIIIFSLAILSHVPFYIDACSRGYDQQFLKQYTLWSGLIRHNLQQQLSHPLPAKARALESDSSARIPQEPPNTEGEKLPSSANQTTSIIQTDTSDCISQEKPSPNAAQSSRFRQRPALGDLQRFKSFRNHSAILAYYLPIPFAAILVISGLVMLIRGYIARRPDLFNLGSQFGISTGMALSLFPQYFFFRPDPPHLSEFMVPFYVALGIGAYSAIYNLTRTRSRIWKLALAAFICGAGFSAFTATFYNIQRDSSGAWAARFGRNSELVAENGVRVLLKPEEQSELQRLHDLVIQFTTVTDYIVCFPYSPTINFMTNRRSYLWNLYIDDATAPADFHDQTLRDFQQYRPAMIIIDNRDINNTGHSRFINWAGKTYQFIQENYVFIGNAAGNEIFVHPEKLGNK